MGKVKTDTNDLVASSQAVKEIDKNTVSINDGMTVKNDGDVKVGKNLEVDGELLVNSKVTFNSPFILKSNGKITFNGGSSTGDIVEISSLGISGTIIDGFNVKSPTWFFKGDSKFTKNNSSFLCFKGVISSSNEYYTISIISLKGTLTCVSGDVIGTIAASFPLTNKSSNALTYYSKDISTESIVEFNNYTGQFTINKDITAQEVEYLFIVTSSHV